MRAAVFVGLNEPLVVEEVNPPEPGPRDVVVHVSASGVCHSDLSVINGTLPFPPPCILGHEGAGVVEHVGEHVTSLKKGDRVVAAFVPACGSCWFCLHDRTNLCEDSFASAMAPRGTRQDGTGQGDPVGQVKGLAGGRGADYAFEVIGLPETILQAWNTARRGGTVVVVGAPRMDATVTFPAFGLFYDEKRLLGCIYGSAQVNHDFERLIARHETGRPERRTTGQSILRYHQV